MNFLQIPESVLVHASKLSGLQLAILADAWTWEKNGKEARRSNDQLAELFGATTRGVTKAVKALQEFGLVELQYGANNIRYIKPRRTVHLNDRSPRTTVHPEQPFDAAPNDRSTPPERPFTPSPERPFTLIEKVIENKEEKRIEKGAKPKKEARPKDLQTVIDAFEQAGASSHLAQRFWNYYEANGWKAGRNPMKDWKAAARNWVTDRNGYNSTSNPNETAPGFDPQRMAEHIKRKYGTPQT